MLNKIKLLTIFFIFISPLSFSHGGGLNKYGCHNDNINGGYHCHRGSVSNYQPKPKIYSKNLSEKEISNNWCKKNGGISEYRTKDNTYVDCLTNFYAIEVEFEKNWKEAIGQSLHYAESTGKKAAILLILQKKRNKDYENLLRRVIRKFNLPIKVFIEEI